MAERYNHRAIEEKWRRRWEETNAHRAGDDMSKPKYYCLDMFPYPSGEGLHVGHWRGYTLSDCWSRYKKIQGFNVMHPMGWDAFGLPAENAAIKKGIHPRISTNSNIANFKRQLRDLSAMYDWSREVNTTDPDYYKWTQWIFLKMFEKGLAYQKEMPINWCPSCKTGLANEEVVGGVCDRCGSEVSKKNLTQWMLKITAYADRLLDDLKLLDWPERILKMQENWIGKSYGAELDFDVKGYNGKLKVFTTRPDTLCGATYMVLAPEHEIVNAITTDEQRAVVDAYVSKALTRSAVDRMSNIKEKTGVFTGAYAINPINQKEIPIWISDYVLADYGTGAIMAVPAHDERDFDFAKEFNLPIIRVIAPEGTDMTDISEEMTEVYVGPGVLVNSGKYDGMAWEKAKEAITADLEARGIGKGTVNYKLRDWVFSRQRYWGEPIPVVHCAECGTVGVPEEQLPIKLPEVERYEPTGTGESPLAGIPDWVNTTCPKCGGPAKRETNTMPQWAGSCWYFLRYCDPDNGDRLISKEKAKYWMPIDLYVGGAEHAVLHLLYARFWIKFLYDIGVVNFVEPFIRLFNQGTIYRNGAKMSKSRGNVVNPDTIVETYGTDSLRLYELFIGPPDVDSEWDDNGIEGVYRFINRTWNIFLESANKNNPATEELTKARHRLVKDVTERLESFRLNTIVSAFMSYTNFLYEVGREKIDKASLETFAILMAPFAPHLSEELWERLGKTGSIFDAKWPTYDEAALADEAVTVPVQVNGRLKATIVVAKSAGQAEVLDIAKKNDAVEAVITGKTVVKEIYVPGKIVNFVVK